MLPGLNIICLKNVPEYMEALTLIDLQQISKTASGKYSNLPLNVINNHVIRMSVMTEAYYWHYHPNSDESFLCLEGQLVIQLEDRTVELNPGQLFTVPTNVLHRTKPKDERSVNLSFELEAMQTIKKEPESLP